MKMIILLILISALTISCDWGASELLETIEEEVEEAKEEEKK